MPMHRICQHLLRLHQHQPDRHHLPMTPAKVIALPVRMLSIQDIIPIQQMVNLRTSILIMEDMLIRL